MNRRRVISPLPMIASFAALLAAAPALAQVGNLDQGQLIDALTEEGMGDLLLHLIEREPPRDEVARAQIEIAQHKLRYADPSVSRDEQVAAYERALDRTRRLIAENMDHEQRPIWQTDLAEMLLIDYLGQVHQNAAIFNEFGVPTAEQRAAFERVAVEALEALASANLRFFQLQGTLPREADHVEKRVNTGLWERMIEEYYGKRTPFYLAHAAHYVGLLPADHPYYLEPNAAVPDKAADAASEKARLIGVAQQALERFTASPSDESGVRLPSLALQGRTQLAAGQPDEALASFEPVTSAKAGDLYDLAANLGTAWALAEKKQWPDALDTVAALQDHALVRSNLLYRVLLADAEHRVLMRQAEGVAAASRQAAVDAAYQPYFDLFAEPDLGEGLPALEGYVFSRWASGASGAGDVSSLPAVVRMAIGEVARIEGQNLMVEAAETGDEAARERARASLERAIEVSEPLTAAGVEPAVRARAMFNLGLATYFSDQQELRNLLGAADVLTRLAAELPDQPQAEEAITGAVQVLRSLHALEERPGGVDEAYREAVGVLFEQFPTSPAADNERLYYGFNVLERGGRHAEAAEVLLRVPPGHPDYFAAQREALFAMESAARGLQGPAREGALAKLREQAEIVRAEAEAESGEEARSALGGVRLVLAGAAMAERAFDEALVQLEGFEEAFPGDAELIRLALERRILAMAESDRLKELEPTAMAMMDSFPASAAAVIDQVLTQLDTRIERLRTEAAAAESQIRRGDLETQAAKLASTASLLSGLLTDWAQAQGYTAEQMLPYELVRAKSQVLAGQASDAVGTTSRLVQSFPQDANVLAQHADALFAVGTDEALVEAAGHYDRLIAGIKPPYPPVWWNAWLRRLQIMDQLKANTSDIPLRVRALKQTDPDLGGERFKDAFERLAEKNAG